MTLVTDFVRGISRSDKNFQKNCNTGLFFKCTLYPQTQCQNDKIKAKLNAIITWSNKKQLESRMVIPEKLQGNINAVCTIYTQVSRTMWAMVIRVLQNQPLRIKCPLKWCCLDPSKEWCIHL